MIAAECGDDAACCRLTEAFLPAIASLARGFQGSRVERRELLQEGVAGLLFAARRYDSELDTPFWAYASFWVRKAMQELVAQLTRPVALSDRAARDLARLRSARNDSLQTEGKEPTTEALSAATGIPPAQVDSLLATDRMPRGLEDRFTADHASSPTIGETIVDPVAEHAYEKVLDDLEIHGVLDLTDELEDRERAVIRGHYGLGQEARTLSEIGAGLGLTAERARQIEAAALAKLRRALARPGPSGAPLLEVDR
ncbi:MAG TPA: sigma-70 family RNA polymerase sigma factor [Solirubrobacteraceae bacterium]|nr:sigma-70 family RNA polymerase sigma factor [Solirubrobacteraceae bacterium]